MDSYRNYLSKDLEYDLFLAISHGQNRGILKKGKSVKKILLMMLFTNYYKINLQDLV